MKNFVVTGVSGSERIELLNELKEELVMKGKTVNVYDIGILIYKFARESSIKISDQKVLDIDRDVLVLLRKLALKEIYAQIMKNPVDFNFIGTHATFRWKGRLISGLSFKDLSELKIDVFINIIDDVEKIYKRNSINPKWKEVELPTPEETNNWIMEEEFITQVISEIYNVPYLLIGRNHRITNLSNLFLTSMKKIYLSYPITHIEKENPKLLNHVRESVLPKLEEKFIVFDPLVIKNMKLASTRQIDLPDSVEKISDKVVAQISARTIERDYKFIDQSDFVVVIYLTEKVSPGVLSEIIYAHKHNKPVYMVFSSSHSPFLLSSPESCVN